MSAMTMSSHLIHEWKPESRQFWLREGRAVAWRNLWISAPTLTLSFAVWMMWSVVVVKLPDAGFRFSANQLFWLAALPGVSGATLRLFFAFMVPVFGGRVWSAVSTAILLIPALGLGFAVQNPDTSYEVLLVLAVLSGLGGGNFASSMANVSFFFPRHSQGLALGLNAGLGNLGVPLVQLIVPLVVGVSLFGGASTGSGLWLHNAGFVWVPFIVLATLAAWFGMDNLSTARASLAEQVVVFRRKHNWIAAALYVGTFGSFLGFAAGFPLLISLEFQGVDLTPWVFVGPLLGALTRVAGGSLSDKLEGGCLLAVAFLVMAAAAAGLVATLPDAPGSGNAGAFFLLFMVLFAASGLGNGALFGMIPGVFLAERRRMAPVDQDRDETIRQAGMETAACVSARLPGRSADFSFPGVLALRWRQVAEWARRCGCLPLSIWYVQR
jgi:NNP family nitrate/nitrite transporter-like MFS transporter